MRHDRGDAAYLLDMLESAQAVHRYVGGKSKATFMADDLLRDAVERRIEIIGDAARFVSDAVKASHIQIPWRKIMGTRHVLAHDYGEVDAEIVWPIATVYVPELIGQLTPLIPALPPDSLPGA